MGIDLPIVWACIIGFGLMMYVIMDGFDLGIGILFPFIKNRDDRDVMVNTVAPVWDGNETWLVLGGAGLMAAFPLAYAVILTALYIPLALMLLGLIWRGVAFEFRFKADEAHKPFWDKAFMLGSIGATFFQGVSLGAFLNGFQMEGTRYTGSAMDWISPFAIFTGLGLLVAYALLGATWLIVKTEGPLHDRLVQLARPLMYALLAVIVVISLWTPLAHQAVADRWFNLPNFFFFAPVPGLVALTAFLLLRSLRTGDPGYAPFLLTLFLLFLGYTGLGISMFPYIIPPAITLRDAAAPPQSMGFALVGALLIIPVILAYTAWAYYVFRGKVRVGDGYH